MNARHTRTATTGTGPMLLIAGALTLQGCAFGPDPDDPVSTGSVEAVVAENLSDPVALAARAALDAGLDAWREEASGARGTVRAIGAMDPKGCVPARLMVHDYTGLRVEERDLCPLPGTDAG